MSNLEQKFARQLRIINLLKLPIRCGYNKKIIFNVFWWILLPWDRILFKFLYFRDHSLILEETQFYFLVHGCTDREFWVHGHVTGLYQTTNYITLSLIHDQNYLIVYKKKKKFLHYYNHVNAEFFYLFVMVDMDFFGWYFLLVYFKSIKFRFLFSSFPSMYF